MCKTIKQKVKFKAPPGTIYELLSDSKTQSEFTGEKAVISRKIGGSFSALSGSIGGIIVDLSPNTRIVQAWRRLDFPDGIFSMATFNLKPTADGGTELVLIHRGVPKDLIPEIELSWREKFWNKIKEHIQEDNQK